MRFLEFGKRNLKELYRDPAALGFLLGMPIVFILIFCFAFGGEHASPICINIVDEDQKQTSAEFIGYLKNMDALSVGDVYYEESEAEERLRTGKISVYLVIPQGFEQAKQNNQPVELELAYKAAEPMLAQRVEPMIAAAASEFWGRTSPVKIIPKETAVEIKDDYINYFVPGVVVFGLMILITSAGGIIVRDKEKGFLARLLTTPTRPWDFILGYTLPFVPVIIVSTMIYLGIGVAMGLSIIGNFGLAFLIFFIIGICCLGIGMIVGTLAKSDEQASAAPWIFIVPMAMISGVWWPAEQMPKAIQYIAQAFPFFHAMDASRDVISGSASFDTLLTGATPLEGFDFYWLVGWTVVLFALGVILFRRQMTVR
jgi:ABC-2 type transport system permease protein